MICSHIMMLVYVFKGMFMHILILKDIERHEQFLYLRSTSIYDISFVLRNSAISLIVATNFLLNAQPTEIASKFEELC
jgi:hypothetical protein